MNLGNSKTFFLSDYTSREAQWIASMRWKP